MLNNAWPNRIKCITTDYIPLSFSKLLHNGRLENEFNVLENIGQGGFSNVFKTEQKFDGKHYAIKQIEFYGENEFQRCMRELRIWYISLFKPGNMLLPLKHIPIKMSNNLLD